MTAVAEKTTGCSFDGCGRDKKSLGLCSAHYRQKRRGRPLSPIRPKKSREVTTSDVVVFEGIPVVTDVEPDGTLTVVTVTVDDWHGVHRRYAMEHFCSDVLCDIEHEYVTSSGGHRVMTIWARA